ncbi:hypothetical protein ACIBCN_36890 [Nocardia sp. NPDC051052]
MLAATGDKVGTAHAVNAAERAFEQVEPEREAEWAEFIDEAYICGE